MKYFSSIFGFCLMLIIPTLLIYFIRQKLSLSNITAGQLNKSIMSNKIGIFSVFIFSPVVLGMIIYGFFTKTKTGCVGPDPLSLL